MSGSRPPSCGHFPSFHIPECGHILAPGVCFAGCRRCSVLSRQVWLCGAPRPPCTSTLTLTLPRHLCSEGLSEGRPGAQAILPLPPSAFVATPSPGCTRPLGRERGSLGPHRQADPQHHLQNARGTAGQATYSPLGSWPVTRGVPDTEGLIKPAASLQSGRQRFVAGHCPSPGDTAEVKSLGHAGDRGPLGSLVWDGSFSYPRGCWD